MKNILIVAAREFRQIAAMRSFWLTLLILPMALPLGPIAQRFLSDDSPTGSWSSTAPAAAKRASIEQRFAADRDREAAAEAVALRPAPQARAGRSRRRRGRSTTAGTATPTSRSSGRRAECDAALARIDRVKPPDTPEFDAGQAGL